MGKHMCDQCGESYMYCACENNPLAEKPKIELDGESFKKLKERCDWEGVSMTDYIKQLMKKCPFPFGG